MHPALPRDLVDVRVIAATGDGECELKIIKHAEAACP
jgi:hypothetical protein